MKVYSLICLTLLTLTQAKAQETNTLQDKRLAGLDSQLNMLLTDAKAAGFAVAVVEKDKVVYAKGFGYRDYERKLPVTPNTLFAIGSSTKAFTSAIVGKLKDDGKVDFDKPALTYLPGFHFFNEKMDKGITIRDMMSHRTGLPRHDLSWYVFKTHSKDSLLHRVQYQEPNKEIREQWQYNNFMFLAQGVIAEKITGKTWEENVREMIFKPLGMARSNFSVFDMQKDADFSFGYRLKKDSIIERLPFFDLTAMGPAGSINSSVNEMTAWLMTWINEGKYKGKEVLSRAYMQEAAEPQMVVKGAGLPSAYNDIFMTSYGLGWFTTAYRGHYQVEHGGNIDGFSASVAFFPSDDLGIVVLTNQGSSPIPDHAHNIIADRMLRLPFRDWNGDLKAGLKREAASKAKDKKTNGDQIKGTHPSHEPAAYEGDFYHPGYGTVNVIRRGKQLYAKMLNDSVLLSHFHYDVFAGLGIEENGTIDSTSVGLRFTFRFNDTGRVDKLLIPLESSLKNPIEFAFQPKQVSVKKATLEKYVGEYMLGAATIRVYLKGDMLYVFVPGQPEYQTAPIDERLFTLTALNGYSVKFDMDGQNAKSITFLQPNGTFVAQKKK